MSSLPPWMECRPDRAGYARVTFQTRALTLDQAPFVSEPLATHVLDMACHSVVLDLAGVEYLSSAAIGAILHLAARLREAGGLTLLANAAPTVLAVLTPFPERQKREPNRAAPFVFLDLPAG
jgi:hypothetical protein